MVVGDPGLVVALVGTRRDCRRLITGQGLGHINGLLGLLANAGSLLSLGKESLDPGLVDEVEGTTEDAGQEEIEEDTSRRDTSTLSQTVERETGCNGEATYI